MSNHCIQSACGDGMLLYHTLTGAVYLIKNNETADAVRVELIKKWCMVPTDFNENEYADRVKQIASLIKPRANFKDHFTILTTTDCNARCRYCYEIGRKRVSMTEQTASDAANYMIKVSGGDRPLTLFWFGGEPLYNINAIDTITDALKKRGIVYRSRMTSNGFYLTPDVIKKAKEEWKLDSVQITIDGTEKNYNRIKAYTDECENPFERVLCNIDNALKSEISVLIRLNMDKSNADDISEVIDILCKRFKGKGNCKVYVALLKSYKTRVNEFDTEQELLECLYSLREKIKTYGMLKTAPLNREIRINCCKADNDVCEIILPDGQLEKCHHYTEGEHIGSIYKSEKDQELIDSWKEIKKDYPECRECTLYPLCLNLKKCDRNRDGCSYSGRHIQIKGIEEQMQIQYNKWKSMQKETGV